MFEFTVMSARNEIIVGEIRDDNDDPVVFTEDDRLRLLVQNRGQEAIINVLSGTPSADGSEIAITDVGDVDVDPAGTGVTYSITLTADELEGLAGYYEAQLIKVNEDDEESVVSLGTFAVIESS